MSPLERLDALLEDAKHLSTECVDSGEVPASCRLAALGVLSHLTHASGLVQQIAAIRKFEERKQAHQERQADNALAKKLAADVS